MNKEREKSILEILLKEKKVSVGDLAKRLFASEPSIRRDLARLEEQKLVKRTHGGAVLEESNHSDMKIPFLIREMEQSDAKLIMARQAAELVHDGDVIMMDASSSAYSLIPFLATKSRITVITSGVKALTKLGEYNIPVYSTGGRLLPSCYSLAGEEAYRILDDYNADIVFFSCRGISAKGMATDFSIEENLVRRKMLEKSRCKVLLCDSKKIGKEYMHNLCRMDEVDYILSELPLPECLAEKEWKPQE